MIAAKITHTRLALSELAGCIPEEAWLFVKRAQAELADAAKMAARLESLPLAVGDAPRIVHPIRLTPEPQKPHLRLVANNQLKGEKNHV